MLDPYFINELDEIVFEKESRYVLAAIIAVTVPFVAVFLYADTPKYVYLIPFYVYCVPACLEALAVSLIFLKPKILHVTGWITIGILSTWIVQTFLLSAFHLTAREMNTRIGFSYALFNGLWLALARIWHSPYVTFPLIIVIALLYFSYRAHNKVAITPPLSSETQPQTNHHVDNSV